MLSACGSQLSEAQRRESNLGLTQAGTAAAPTAAGPSAAQQVGPGDAASSPVASGPATVAESGSAAPGGLPAIATGRADSGAGARVAGPGTKSEILLGSFGTGSGPIGAQLASIPVATRAWVADVNARGGLNGHPVRVIYGDDGGDPARALAIVRRMVEQDHVLAFFGTYGATTVQAVTSYLEQHNIPIIGTEGGNPIEDVSPMVFDPQVGADQGVSRGFVSALVSQSPARKIALLYCQEAATCTNGGRRIKEYAPKVGVSIVYEAQVSLAQPDYTAEMIAARNAGAEAILMYIDVASIVRAIRSAHRQGWKPVFVGGVAVNEEGIKQGGSDVEGVLAPAATVPYSASSKLAPYLNAVRTYVPGGLVGGTGASAWTQGKLLEHAAAKLGDNPSTQDLLNGLYAMQGDDLGGLVPPLTFQRGPHGSVNMCIVPLRFQGGQFVAPKGDAFVCAP